MKRILAVLLAVGALAAATAGGRAVDGARDQAVRREATRAAEAAGMRASDALAAHVGELKLEAHNAASNPRLVAALRGNVDAATLQDLFRSEEWWEPYRNAFKVYALAFEGENLDVIEGMKTAEFASDLLVREARERREAVSEIVMGRGWPYAAAAVAIDVPERRLPLVLVLARPVDEAAVRKLSEKARGAVLLSDGKTPVIETGPDGQRELLRTAVGSEGKGPLFQPPAQPGADASPHWAAAVSALAPGLWMWTFASGADASADSANAAAATKGAIWTVAALLAAALLFLGFRRGQSATPPGLTAELPGLGAAGGQGLPVTRPPTSAAPPGATRPGTGTTAPVSPSAATELHRTDGGAGAAPSRLGAGKAVIFGRYTLLDRLGEGGMAEVYTAATFGAEGFRRTFVVKRLRAELAREPAVVAQFIDEANLASSLVHSNIIPVFDFGKVGNEYFMAQEYILGRDLGRLTARVIERGGRALAPLVVFYAAAETLKALEYAHTKLGDNGRPLGIVHRDVSPSNILLSARGEVKLFDFGIVKAEGRVTKTQHGVVKGNVSFMSPEQARGVEVDARADLFSLGLVMYYALTGEVLYRGNTTYELLVKAATGPGPDELPRIAALPAPAADIVRRALQIDPAGRYASAADFAAAVAPHVAGAPAEAARLMKELFASDFQQEEARFAAAIPATDPGAATGLGGTQELGSRRS
ncbi:MAG TPA: serine/threonine-protein kinase [Polyangia bacterium]|nr:serine/threonine-protein kinase [Polyangia bacterium]